MSYIGYKEQESRDFSKLTDRVLSALQSVDAKKKQERAELEALDDSLVDSIAGWQPGEDQSMNTMILKGAQDIRKNMFEWNKLLKKGVLTPEEYKAKINNTQEQWSTLSQSVNNYEPRMQEIVARSKPDENGNIAGSGLELHMNAKAANDLDIKNSSILQDKATGSVYMVKYDNDGNIIDQKDVRNMNNAGNIVDNRVNLENVVSGYMDNAAVKEQFKDLGLGGTLKQASPKLQEEWSRWVQTATNAIITDKRSAASVLTDNAALLPNGASSNFRYYDNEEDKQQQLQEALENEREIRPDMTPEEEKEFLKNEEIQLIGLSEVDGVTQPNLTKEQMDIARERVKLSFNMQAGFEESGTAKRSAASFYGWNSRSGGSSSGDEGLDWTEYAAIEKGWNNKDEDSLNSTALPGYRFKFDGDNIVVEKYTKLGGDTPEWVSNYDTIKYKNGDAKNLSPYVFKTGTVKGREVSPSQQFENQRQAKKGSTGNSNNSDPLNIMQ